MANVIEEFINKKKMDEAAKDAGIKKGDESMEGKTNATPEGTQDQENSGADTPKKESKKGKILGIAKKVGGYALAGLAGAAAVFLREHRRICRPY